jgi:hypothetical protein
VLEIRATDADSRKDFPGIRRTSQKLESCVDLNGTTEVVSLFDLAQVLSVNEATGMLKVESNGAKGYLYFQAGSIINALDGEHAEGEDAAKHIFAMKSARFTFGTDLPSVAHRINSPTQNLMMEIARQLDEETADDDGSGAGLGERVREACETTRELHEIFTRLDSESRIEMAQIPGDCGVPDLLKAIQGSAESVLYLREGAAPEVQAGGRMIPLSKSPLSGGSYARLREVLLGAGADSVRGRFDERTLASDEYGRYRVEAWPLGSGELLALRWLTDPQALVDNSPWPEETIGSLFVETGSLVLVSAPSAPRLARAFEAVCASLLATTGESFLGLARRWTPGLGDGRAAVILLSTLREEEWTRARELSERMNPAYVAVEDVDHPTALPLALGSLRRGARALVGVTASCAAQVPFRLFEATEPSGRDALVRHLGMSLSGVLRAPAQPAQPGRAWMVEEAARIALLEGDVNALVHELSTAG